ncbi:hypothetical protein J5M77_07385 [Bacillus amyloliquefaciens]|uniref:hypothetical protein n=1 Tax=Bacillus velezensis TaxID=492670 RepID=UPI001ABEE27F|nr:hypothetical protein [Bacillus velezensis]MBO3790249.1 hypothetical protein [Bacillus velezensis]
MRIVDLLISCPSDVTEEVEVIEKTVNEFNKKVGRKNNIIIMTKHWSKDSYPQSGGRPQDLLNQQFVLDCHAAVAVFWTRFGTPTDEYGSGTEEEIETLIQSGKQVFLYFCEKEVKPSDIDFKQYQKIEKFKEKYRQNNIYSPYTTLEDFKDKLYDHLCLHYEKVSVVEESLEPKSELSIKGELNGELIDSPVFFNLEFSKIDFIEEDKTAIVSKIESIKRFDLIREQEDTQVNNAWANVDFSQSLLNGKEVYISDYEKETIRKFAKDNMIEIDDFSFFDLAGLKVQKNIIMQSVNFVGSTKAKEKYKEISELVDKIEKFNEWISYVEKLDSVHYLRLCLSNQGNRYDEDIDVKLFIKEGFLCKPEDIPVPGYQIMEECEDSILRLYKGKSSLSINAYDEYPSETIMPILPYPSKGEIEKQKREEFKKSLENIFIYEHYNKEGYDILKFKQSYLKHKNNVLFPSILLFNSLPDSIQYEIQSKYSSDIVSSEIEFNKKQ